MITLAGESPRAMGEAHEDAIPQGGVDPPQAMMDGQSEGTDQCTGLSGRTPPMQWRVRIPLLGPLGTYLPRYPYLGAYLPRYSPQRVGYLGGSGSRSCAVQYMVWVSVLRDREGDGHSPAIAWTLQS